MKGLFEQVQSRNKESLNFFLSVYITSLGLSISILALLPSWFGYRASEAISYNVNDGWCDPSQRGFGLHCFGDFYYPLTMTNLDNPWSATPNPYPPVTMFVYKFFSLLTTLSDGRLALGVYLAISVAAIGCAVIHAHLKLFDKSFLLTGSMIFLIFSSSPTIISIDRGNNQIFLLPLLYFFSYSILRSQDKKALFLGILLTLFKPQLGVFVLIFVVYRRLGIVWKWILYSGVLYFLSFALYFKSFPSNFGYWIVQIIRYQEYAEKGGIFPVNLSLTNLIEIPFRVFDKDSPGILISLVGFALLSMALICLIKYGSSFSLGSNLLFISLLPVVFVSTSFHYYLLLATVPLLLILFESQFPETVPNWATNKSLVFCNFFVRMIAGTAIILTFIPWSIPYVLDQSLLGRGWSVIGVNWLPGQLLLNLTMCAFIWQLWRSRKDLPMNPRPQDRVQP